MSYASVSDVAARFGSLSDAQEALVPTLLDDVELLIKRRIPDLDALVIATTVALATVVKVESWAVIRHLRNPDGKYQESIDDYSFTRDRTVAAGALYITDDEWDELLGSATTSSAFTIRTDAGWEPSSAYTPYTDWS